MPLIAPTLETPLCTLRPWQIEDAPMLRDAFGRHEIFGLTDAPTEYSTEAAEDWILRQLSQLVTRQAISLAIVPSRAQLPVGLVGLFGDPFPPVAQLSFWLIPNARGHRLATTAASTLVDWAFPALPELCLIRIDREPTNEATARIAARVGARYAGSITKRIKEADVQLERYELSRAHIPS